MKSLRYLSMLLSFTLVFGTLSLFTGAGGATAAVTRVAVVKELKGSVKIKKSGGSKAFNAFKNMSLNEGDSLTTGGGAKVVLELADDKADKDEMTVGESSQITFTKLADDSGAKAKMNIWAGSMWIKVKSISNANDQFEIETPTAIMGVRGTYFFTTVDKNTGLTKVVVAAGVVAADTNPENGNSITGDGDGKDVQLIYPAQQISLFEKEAGKEESQVTYLDLNEFVKEASPDIIEALLKNTQEIAEENRGFAKKWSSELDGSNTTGPKSPTQDPAELERIRQNLERLANNVAKTAVDKGKLPKETVDNIAKDVNSNAKETLLDLSNVKPLELTAAEKEMIEKQKAALELAVKKAEEERKKREDELLKLAKEQLDALLKKIEAQKKEQERLALEDKAKAEKEYLAKLDKAKQDEFNKKKEENKANTEPKTGTGSGKGNSGGTTDPVTDNKPTVTLAPSKSTMNNPAHGEELLLDVKFGKFNTDKKIYGYQIKIKLDNRFTFNETAFANKVETNTFRTRSPFGVEPADGWPGVSDPKAVDHFFMTTDSGSTLFNYAVASFKGTGVQLNTEQTVVTIPLSFNTSTLGTSKAEFAVMEILAVDSTGATIASFKATDTAPTMTINKAEVNITVTSPPAV